MCETCNAIQVNALVQIGVYPAWFKRARYRYKFRIACYLTGMHMRYVREQLARGFDEQRPSN